MNSNVIAHRFLFQSSGDFIEFHWSVNLFMNKNGIETEETHVTETVRQKETDTTAFIQTLNKFNG